MFWTKNARRKNRFYIFRYGIINEYSIVCSVVNKLILPEAAEAPAFSFYEVI